MEQVKATEIVRKMVFSKEMNKTVKWAVKRRLDVLLTEEERSYDVWQDRHRQRINVTRQQAVERNYLKRISALRIVCWMLTDTGDRTGDLPPMVIKRKKDLKPKKEPKLLEAPPKQEPPVISQDALNMLESLASLLKPKAN